MIYLVEYEGILGWYQRVMRAENLVDLIRQIKLDRGTNYNIKACLGEGSLK